MFERKYLLDAEIAEQKLHRMALEIAENLDGDEEPLVLIGIRKSGTVVAEIVGSFVKQYIPNKIIILSVTLDKHHPTTVELSEQIDLTGKNVILADDVSNSGKTLTYALKPLLNFYPKRIQTLVLVERMHKFFPVKPDYVGSSIATTLVDFIKVETSEGKITGAYIE
jgi:pyrimidine operon attenuation protein/uracil phosphoribosyltransferase